MENNHIMDTLDEETIIAMGQEVELMQDIVEDYAGVFCSGQGEERFKIDSDAKAEWAIRKIAEEEAECERLVDCCEAEIDRYRARQDAYHERCEKRTANLRAMLLLYFGTVPVKETKTQQKYELPSGSLVMKKPSSDFKPDPNKLRDWLQAGKMTDYLKTEVSPKWALVKKQLSTTAKGEIVFGETGEIMPEGVITIEEKPGKFEVKAR